MINPPLPSSLNPNPSPPNAAGQDNVPGGNPAAVVGAVTGAESSSAPQRAKVLLVDDNIENLTLLSQMLEQQNHEVRRAINGAIALQAAQNWHPDLILLDITMPELSGYEVCQRLKAHPLTANIPVIFISALNDTLDKVQAFAVGGVDYITKPFEISEVLARVQNQLSLQTAQAEILRLNDDLERRVQRRTAQLQALNHSLKQEINKREQAQEQLRHIAFHDVLTDLPNRTQLLSILQQSLARAKQQPDFWFAMLLLDCDRFKLVNDSLGHVMGDRLLVAIAQRLKTVIPEGSILARLGGDEFAILLEDLDLSLGAKAAAEQVAQMIQTELSHPFWLNDQELFMTISMGIVLGNGQYDQPQDILRDSDTAMYHAKELGKAQYCCFDPKMYERALARLTLDSQMRRALEKQEFSLVYQPIISIATGQVAGFEALLRWPQGEQGFISPAEFIPVAEETGVIVPLGLWVLRQACQQMRDWQRLYQQSGRASICPWKMSVNLSVQQFSQPNLIEKIDRILEETQLDGQWLKLEITETALMENADSATALLQALKQRQIQLVIDDFGTGYSSLSYLHRFPVDTLKIDQSFVKGLGHTHGRESAGNPLAPDPTALSHDLRIVKAAIYLAHDLGIDIVAEGIEQEAVLQQLKAMNCDWGQGYFFSPPLSADAMGAWLGLV